MIVALSLPLYPGMMDEDVQTVVNAVRGAAGDLKVPAKLLMRIRWLKSAG